MMTPFSRPGTSSSTPLITTAVPSSQVQVHLRLRRTCISLHEDYDLTNHWAGSRRAGPGAAKSTATTRPVFRSGRGQPAWRGAARWTHWKGNDRTLTAGPQDRDFQRGLRLEVRRLTPTEYATGRGSRSGFSSSRGTGAPASSDPAAGRRGGRPSSSVTRSSTATMASSWPTAPRLASPCDPVRRRRRRRVNAPCSSERSRIWGASHASPPRRLAPEATGEASRRWRWPAVSPGSSHCSWRLRS